MPGHKRQGVFAINRTPHAAADITDLLESELAIALADLEGDAPLMATMARYHLGLTDPNGQPTDETVRKSVQGKRIRPQLAFHCCSAVGGHPADAAPVAAAIELLHNFTLIHDDIQDRSPNRRHRATVWRIWGDAQAINAGDALFAASQRTLLRTSLDRVPAETVLRLIDEFNRVTIEIVRGQVMDLELEREAAVSPETYLTMIRGKTAAIVRYAAWAGAIVGGASDSTAKALGQFGEALGLGFQLRDDVLGIWGTLAETGKDQADDIRRRKKSLPILMLLQQAPSHELERLAALYARDPVDEQGVRAVLELLERHDIRRLATEQVAHYHRLAAEALEDALAGQAEPSSLVLEDLIRRLDARVS